MDDPAFANLHPAADRASRGPLNGFPGALAEVVRHRIGGGAPDRGDTWDNIGQEGHLGDSRGVDIAGKVLSPLGA